MYHVSSQGVDERMINVHYYYYLISLMRRKVTDDLLHSAILRSLEQTYCARMWFYMIE